MSEEEIIDIVKTEITNSYAERKAKALQGLLDLYNKEKETSHFIQSQLDIANAKLIEEKEKNEYLKIIVNKLMPLAECYYWDYENHTCTHTCRDCDGLNANNKRTATGILIEKDRYCRLYEDGHADEDTKFVNVEDLIKRHLKK